MNESKTNTDKDILFKKWTLVKRYLEDFLLTPNIVMLCRVCEKREKIRDWMENDVTSPFKL